MSNAKILLVCFVGYILLISDVPYFSAANIYEVVRSKRWTIMPVRVIALLKVTLLYFAVLFVLFCILGGCTDFNPNVWDRIHYSYAHGQYIEDLYMDVPGNVIANYTPFSAFCDQSVPAVARLYQHGPALAVCGHAVARKKSAAREPVRLGRV